jgi:DNA-binding winged helix-turn-helix (wHTH) protein/Tfp pilus assembly protein PilF
MSARIVRFGVFELDADALELHRGGTRIRLAGKPAQLLLYLAERPGQVVSRDELRRALWSDGTFVDFDHGLNNAINKLRTTLCDSSEAPRYIETLPKIGYRFIAMVDSMRVEEKQYPRSLVMGTAVSLLLLAAAVAVAVQRDRATSRASAHEAYVKGREELASNHPEAFARARAYFERALQVDPKYAPAHCGLAMALNRAGVWGVADPIASHRQAVAAANAALRLDPSLAEAYVARATARIRLEWDWGGAESDLRRAISLDPDFVKPHQLRAQFLAAQGRSREALREIGTARQLDPLAASLRRDEGLILYYSRQYDTAIERLRAVIAHDPGDARARKTLSDAYLQIGNAAAAAEELLRWLELVGVNAAEIERARAQIAQGGFPALWRRVASGSPKKGHAYKVATAFAALGRRDEAIRALEEAFANREAQLLYLKTDPYLDPLRGDPRFTALLARARM